MPLLVLGILVVWTIIVFRLISFRTILGPRTLFTLMALGAPLGTVANPLAEKFFNSYSYNGNQLYVMLIIASQHLLLVAPALLLLARPAWRRSVSVCDAFLVAFAIGAGYEFFGALMALIPAQSVANGLSFLPPGVASNTTTTVAGYGYWGGLVALVCAVAFRFLRNSMLAYGTTALALIVCTLDHFADFSTPPAGTRIAVITMHGALLPWLTILFLVGAVVLELRWSNSQGGIKNAVAGFQAVVSATAGLKWNEAKFARTRYQLSQQAEILSAEQQHDAGNTAIQSQMQSINGLLGKLATTIPAPQLGVKDWLKRRWPQLLAVGAFLYLGILLNMPDMRELANWTWSSLPLNEHLVPLQLTLVASILVVVLLWRYVDTPRQAFSRARTDEVTQFSAERHILQLGLGVVLVALLYPHPREFIAFQSTIARGAGLQVPGFNETQALTLLLVLVWAVGTLTVRRAELWCKRVSSGYLSGLARNFISLGSIATVAWLAFTFFTQIQVYAHAHWGATFFNYFHTNGNSILEMALGALTAVFSFGAAWLVRWLAVRFEKKLLDSCAMQPRPLQTAVGTGR